MFLLLLAFSICYQQEYGYDQNGLRKKLKKLGKHITKPVAKVFKQAGKAVSHATKPITRFIHHSSDSAFDLPCQIQKFDTNTATNDWVVEDLNQAVNDIASQFSLDAGAVQNFLNRARFTSQAKRLFNQMNFGLLNDHNYRTAQLGGTVIKVSRPDGHFHINVRQVQTVATIFASTKSSHKSSSFGFSHHSSHVDWRALQPNELNDVFSACNEEIAPHLNNYKAI